MDTITQMTLGAAVGEAVLGKKIGGRAILWGAVLGTLPDLDVIINPFVDGVVEMRNHRGFTHSLFFCLLFSPIIGSAFNRWYAERAVGWQRWSWMVFLIFGTHILIDTITTYGTQVLYPLSDIPFTTDSMFIIDPFYTLPLLSGLILSLFMKRDSGFRRLANGSGLALSTLYIIWGLGIKSHVHTVFSESFENRFGYHEMLKTTPNGPNTFLWTGYAVRNDTVYNANYSLFDTSQELNFLAIPRNSYLIEPYIDDRAVETLLWFSRGYYTVEKTDSSLYFNDLRFGRDDLWLTDEGNFVWKNRILFNEEGEAHSFEQILPSFDTRSQNISLFMNRIRGK
ncbi:metal-dependent hydrolase [Rhodohalobacter mucosus]|uniref:Metal-dependent hydrolase n=1 Tax=Rhodohalobacter mucosus TaxID=2079485 RepID=A0A316TNB0_9BACT|nr:metal-dependent hydrolase [Rhodohalobacter mucosus]PWN05900.1 metal-dependent hydrolase [Rhodohalobacter mucosus]